MTRSIGIYYRLPDNPDWNEIEIQNPYELFGCQDPSVKFWALSCWDEIGVRRLAELGRTDPVDFYDWDGLDTLDREIRLIQDNVQRIPYEPAEMCRWLANLVYCSNLLRLSAPDDSVPIFSIG